MCCLMRVQCQVQYNYTLCCIAVVQSCKLNGLDIKLRVCILEHTICIEIFMGLIFCKRSVCEEFCNFVLAKP